MYYRVHPRLNLIRRSPSGSGPYRIHLCLDRCRRGLAWWPQRAPSGPFSIPWSDWTDLSLELHIAQRACRVRFQPRIETYHMEGVLARECAQPIPHLELIEADHARIRIVGKLRVSLHLCDRVLAQLHAYPCRHTYWRHSRRTIDVQLIVWGIVMPSPLERIIAARKHAHADHSGSYDSKCMIPCALLPETIASSWHPDARIAR